MIAHVGFNQNNLAPGNKPLLPFVVFSGDVQSDIFLTGQAWEGVAVFVSIKREK